MTKNYEIRSITGADIESLLELQLALPDSFSQTEPLPVYRALCADTAGATCFVALEEQQPVACLLAFVREREGYCTTIAVRPSSERSPAVAALLARSAAELAKRVDTCWISLTEGDQVARSLCRTLHTLGIGVRVAYGRPVRNHIAARIDRARRERLLTAVAHTQP